MITREFPYQKSSADLFRHIAHLEQAVFIDSGGLDRFDILAAQPKTTITVAHQATHIKKNNQSTQTHLDPFTATKKALDQLQKQSPGTESTLPFTAGAIGYMSYDISKQLEKLPNTTINDIQLPQAVIGIYHWSIIVDHHEKKLFLNAINEAVFASLTSIITLLSNPITHIFPGPFQVSAFTSNLTQAEYAAQFAKIKKHIIEGDTYQINFAQRFSATYNGDLWHAYCALRETHPAPFSSFFSVDPNSAILSCSPERFLKVTNGEVETKPIKGTMPRYPDPKDDKASAKILVSSEKDRAENIMIVDLLRNDLSKICQPGSVITPKICELESFSNVHHLVSTVKGTLKPDHYPMDLFKNCFPGGSITGAPKISAMKIIDSLEPHHRSIYCGSIFYADMNGHFDSNIAIRTMIADNGTLHCYGGGGIVYDSDCEKEYEETFAKVGKMLKTLERFQC